MRRSLAAHVLMALALPAAGRASAETVRYIPSHEELVYTFAAHARTGRHADHLD